MRIVAALPWYDESTAFLDRCVRSLEGVVDVLVALDGRWQLYDEDAPVLSHWTQSHAIARAADAITLEHYVYMGPTVWQSQVEKRRALMELASEQGDWVLVIDADEYVASSYPGHLRPALKETELDVATVLCTRLLGDMPTRRIRRLFRKHTSVERAHNGYVYEGRWLHGDSARVHLEPALDVSGWLELHSSSGMRDPSREAKSLEYRQRRRVARLEW